MFEREIPEYTEKNLSKQQQTQPTNDPSSGNRSRVTLAGGECASFLQAYFQLMSWARKHKALKIIFCNADNLTFSLYLKKADLASRNVVNL